VKDVIDKLWKRVDVIDKVWKRVNDVIDEALKNLMKN
jgi:hypothetical protein